VLVLAVLKLLRLMTAILVSVSKVAHAGMAEISIQFTRLGQIFYLGGDLPSEFLPSYRNGRVK